MRHISLALSIVSLALNIGRALGGSYDQTNSHAGRGFLDNFSFEAIRDPTNGRVNYVDAATAAKANLTYATADRFVLRSDFKKYLSSSGVGRDSVRIISNREYKTSVLVFNVRHMPEGCGTWPAIWTVGTNWPYNGEIDILEGINDQAPNAVTLHTSSGCKMPTSRSQTGISTGDNCDVAATNNVGCGVKHTDSRSYGPAFNKNGGGWYAMERTSSFIKVWFWPRTAGDVPWDVANGASSVDTNNWGTPVAYFPGTSCPMNQRFGPHRIVINLTFCGDWAGNEYSKSGCPSSCIDFVNNNPSAFTNAHFDFEWLKIYE